jgi:hypothetical protein
VQRTQSLETVDNPFDALAHNFNIEIQ